MHVFWCVRILKVLRDYRNKLRHWLILGLTARCVANQGFVQKGARKRDLTGSVTSAKLACLAGPGIVSSHGSVIGSAGFLYSIYAKH